MKKASDNELLESYNKHNSVWKVGKEHGMCGQSVQERLKKIGANINGSGKKWSELDEKKLLESYLVYRNVGKLEILAGQMNRSKHYICRKAKELGLTDKNHIKKYMSVWKYMNEDVARLHMDNFKKSSLTLGRFCKKNNYSEVGFWQTMKSYFPGEYEATIESKTPKQTKYRLGRSFEYRCRDSLKQLGYFVMRSPASKSPIDLVAIKRGQVLFIQCKRSDNWHNIDQWNEFYELSLSVGAKPTYCHMPDGKTQGIVFKEIINRKDRSRRPAPCVEFQP